MPKAYERIEKQYTMAEVLSLMNPLIQRWFSSKFTELTEPQSYAVPLIHSKENIVVSSPTGSGKTMTAFLSIINELLNIQSKGKLEDRVYAVYVSPLRALANDINKNLNQPLQELTALATEMGIEIPKIRVAVRSGDTSSYERQKMVRKPPHIFITTPESLALTLSSPVFRTKFNRTGWVILDELHEICDSKRGEFLSLTLERLADYCEESFVRIGLSATMAPIVEMAAFLGGTDKTGEPRPVKIVEIKAQKSLDLGVICPVRDLNAVQADIANAKMYDELVNLIEKHTTTLVFTNTRSATESVAYKLKERGLVGIEAHHGSLSKVTRKDVEDQLKSGKLKCVISSTSLELGIDIGSIDLVCQIGSPKSVAKGLQRIGRSGHSIGRMSTGRLLVFDTDDLVECAVLTRSAMLNRIDRVDIPENSLDVLAQTIVGMSLEKKWSIEDAYALVKRSYCYRNLPRRDFLSVLRYLGSKGEFENVYSKIWLDESEGVFGKKKSARMIYFLNLGTIAEESSYDVVSERGIPLGQLSDKFVERLSPKDIFVLGGRSYEYIRARGMTVLVKDARGRKPTVPSWTGEMLPRSFDLSEDVGRFRAEMERMLDKSDQELIEHITRNYSVDSWSARSIINYLREQKATIPVLPTNSDLVIEGVLHSESGKRVIIFHFPFGRRTNDALARGFANAISRKYKCNTSVSVSDDNFLISVPKEIPLKNIHSLLHSKDLTAVLMSSLKDSELFKQRFRQVAARSFMILRNYRGKELSVSRQQLRSSTLLDQLGEIKDFPVVRETYNEILNDVMDIEHASAILRDIEEGKRRIHVFGYTDTPSPFSHSILLSGVADVILMEDKSSMLRELHRKVLSRVMGKDQKAYEFESDVVEKYFQSKWPRIDEMDQLPQLLRTVGPLIMLKERGTSIHLFTEKTHETVREWALSLLEKGQLSTIWLDDIYFIPSEEEDEFASLCRKRDLLPDETQATRVLSNSGDSIKELSKKLSLPSEETNELMHRLESLFLAKRLKLDSHDGWLWVRNYPTPADSEKSLEKVLVRQLEYFGPQTSEELSYRFRCDAIIQKAEELVSEGLVSKGYFVAEEVEQYMLTRDYLALRNTGVKVYDYATIQRYLFRKSMQPLPSIKDYFIKFCTAGMILDVFNRVPSFSRGEWEALRCEEKIVSGRFLKGRVRYVREEDIPLFVSAYRDDSISEEDMLVLEKLKQMGKATSLEVIQELKLSRERGREIIERLDRGLWLKRVFVEGEEWSGRNVYSYLECNTKVENARQKIVERIIRGQGPIRAGEIRSQTGFWDMDIDDAAEKAGAARIVVGDASNQMYVMPDELGLIEEAGAPDESSYVLSMLDPYVQPLWAEVASKYGEGWFYPIVNRGRVAGMAEIWVMASCIEVRQLNISMEGEVPSAVSALIRFSSLYSQFNLDVLRIREFNSEPVDKLDVKVSELFIGSNFKKVNGMLVFGNITDQSFDRKRIISFTLQRQHIEQQFSDINEAISFLMGLRSNYEAVLRVKRILSLEYELRDKRLLYAEVMPEHSAYTNQHWASVCRAAKSRKLSKVENHVLDIISEFGPAGKKQVMQYSNMSKAATQAAIRTLFRKSVIALDGNRQYVEIAKIDMSRTDALRSIVEQLFRQFGALTAEQLSRMLKSEMNMKQLREMLFQMESGGKLVKGYLEKGSDSLYWILADDLKQLRRAHFSRRFISTMDDRLSLLFAEDSKRMFGMTSANLVFDGPELVGAFKGRIKENEVKIDKFEGKPEIRELMQDLASEMGVVVKRKSTPREEEWDVVGFYERTHPGR
jgi:ATP-dependent Lhr-like helicase